VPPYVIFSDKTLIDIARLRPRSRSELLLANGVGDSKVQRYGEAVLKVVRDS
jgi:ATP-dependent DNA helicase RecQ